MEDRLEDRLEDRAIAYSHAPRGHECWRMQLYWHNVVNSSRYRYNTAMGRRMMEIRFSIAKAVRAKRRALRLTQGELAVRVGSDQSKVSAVECGRAYVSLDIAVRLLVHMNATDEEIANAFNAGAHDGVRKIRERAQLRCYPKPFGG